MFFTVRKVYALAPSIVGTLGNCLLGLPANLYQLVADNGHSL